MPRVKTPATGTRMPLDCSKHAKPPGAKRSMNLRSLTQPVCRTRSLLVICCGQSNGSAVLERRSSRVAPRSCIERSSGSRETLTCRCIPVDTRPVDAGEHVGTAWREGSIPRSDSSTASRRLWGERRASTSYPRPPSNTFPDQRNSSPPILLLQECAWVVTQCNWSANRGVRQKRDNGTKRAKIHLGDGCSAACTVGRRARTVR